MFLTECLWLYTIVKSKRCKLETIQCVCVCVWLTDSVSPDNTHQCRIFLNFLTWAVQDASPLSGTGVRVCWVWYQNDLGKSSVYLAEVYRKYHSSCLVLGTLINSWIVLHSGIAHYGKCPIQTGEFTLCNNGQLHIRMYFYLIWTFL